MTLIGVNERGYRVGQYHHRAKLSDLQVDCVRELYETGCIGCRSIARALGVSRILIRRIVHFEMRYQTPSRFVRR